jgi:ABC-type Fe3+ transport system substrate-binding protein
MKARLAIAMAFVVVLSLPFLVRALAGGGDVARLAAGSATGGGAPTLIVVTPHVEQIRLEFGAAFNRWHQRLYGSPAAIDWRTPGGTSEIIKQLEAQFDAAARGGRIGADGRAEKGAVGFDLFFGGGSFEHGKMKAVRKAPGASGAPIEYRMGQPAGFTQQQLDEWFGQNKIGVQTLYDPDQYWIGTALSGFGIVYNKDVLKRLGLPEPRSFGDLCDPRYSNMLALADPRQSGSVTTTFESIMNKEGWDRGWRILREMCANARYFASAATRVPVDVSQGEAAAGLAIDFYGRGQAQFTVRPGQDPATARVGYVDPQGAVYIDADPASILNGAPNAELARRFVAFCLSDEAQVLWQMPPRSHAAGDVTGWPNGPDGRPLGPERYELRRMPVRRAMYEQYGRWFVDKANPFELASDVPGRGWRGAISPMMAAFGADVMPELRAAWAGLNRVRDQVKAGKASEGDLAELEAAFYSWPKHRMKDGAEVEFNEANFKAIYADADKFKDTEHARRTLIAYTKFFRGQYRRVASRAAEIAP